MWNELKEYVLLNKDVKIARFTIRELGDSAFLITDCKILCQTARFKDKFDIEAFIESRKPYKGRMYMDALIAKYNLNSVSALIRLCFLVSLNDTYWVKPSESRITWNSVSPYRNSFNEIVANMAFTGNLKDKLKAEIGYATYTPEIALNGITPKRWRRINGNICLIKKGTAYGNYQEPFVEMLVSQLLSKMNYDSFVKYRLSYSSTGEAMSVCPIFTDEQYGLRFYYPLYSFESLEKAIAQMDNLGLADAFCNLFILDTLIWNQDRHMQNFGFIVNNDTEQIVSFAPVYDCGLSLLAGSKDQTLSGLRQYSTKVRHRLGVDFALIKYLCMGDSQRRMLNAIKDFKFQLPPNYKSNKNRVLLLEQLLEERLNWLLT